MTEKRFTLFDEGETIIDNETVADDGGKQIYWTVEYIQMRKLVELLNKLHEENEQLKKQLASINQLIDNKIDEFKNGDYGDLPCNTIHMFLDLKQELGDVE